LGPEGRTDTYVASKKQGDEAGVVEVAALERLEALFELLAEASC
jgi:hypothetical protein